MSDPKPDTVLDVLHAMEAGDLVPSKASLAFERESFASLPPSQVRARSDILLATTGRVLAEAIAEDNGNLLVGALRLIVATCQASTERLAQADADTPPAATL